MSDDKLRERAQQQFERLWEIANELEAQESTPSAPAQLSEGDVSSAYWAEFGKSDGIWGRMAERLNARLRNQPNKTVAQESTPGAQPLRHERSYLEDLRHDLHDEKFAYEYLLACAQESTEALQIGVRDLLAVAHPPSDWRDLEITRWREEFQRETLHTSELLRLLGLVDGLLANLESQHIGISAISELRTLISKANLRPEGKPAEAAPAEPWAYAIETPGGDMYDGEYAVFGDLRSAQDQVDSLNDEIPEGEPEFRAVPLYRAAGPALEGQRETKPFSELIAKWRTGAERDRIANAELNARLKAGETVTITTLAGPYADQREICAAELEAILRALTREPRPQGDGK